MTLPWQCDWSRRILLLALGRSFVHIWYLFQDTWVHPEFDLWFDFTVTLYMPCTLSVLLHTLGTLWCVYLYLFCSDLGMKYPSPSLFQPYLFLNYCFIIYCEIFISDFLFYKLYSKSVLGIWLMPYSFSGRCLGGSGTVWWRATHISLIRILDFYHYLDLIIYLEILAFIFLVLRIWRFNIILEIFLRLLNFR